ncbi:hypothetical protein D3C81_825640 [compost metagenome]
MVHAGDHIHFTRITNGRGDVQLITLYFPEQRIAADQEAELSDLTRNLVGVGQFLSVHKSLLHRLAKDLIRVRHAKQKARIAIVIKPHHVAIGIGMQTDLGQISLHGTV